MKALDLIKEGEGYRECTYRDPGGIPTVCFGYNLLDNNAMLEVKEAGGNYLRLIRGGCTTRKVCNNLLKVYLKRSKDFTKNIFGHLSCVYA